MVIPVTISKETLQGIKKGLLEVARWVGLFILSWFITETASQLTNIPEFYELHIWVFTYLIPVRLAFQFLLTLLGRLVDKALHVRGKLLGKDGWLGVKGLTGF